MSINFMLNDLAGVVVGQSLKTHDGRLNKEVKALFGMRNDVAHRGLTPEVDSARQRLRQRGVHSTGSIRTLNGLASLDLAVISPDLGTVVRQRSVWSRGTAGRRCAGSPRPLGEFGPAPRGVVGRTRLFLSREAVGLSRLENSGARSLRWAPQPLCLATR